MTPRIRLPSPSPTSIRAVLLALVLAAAPLHAAQLVPADPRLPQVRAAIEAAERGDFDAATYASLADHPLYPWIEYAALRRDADTLPVAEGQNIAVQDIAAAQWQFGELGRLQRIDVKLAAGVDPARMRGVIAAALPADAEIVNRDSEARRTDALSRAYRVNLDMLALMALLFFVFTGFRRGTK